MYTKDAVRIEHYLLHQDLHCFTGIDSNFSCSSLPPHFHNVVVSFLKSKLINEFGCLLVATTIAVRCVVNDKRKLTLQVYF